MSPREFLFLQGPCSPLFRRLAASLRAQGAHVHKVHFNAGDAAFWAGPATLYRGTLATLPAWTADVLRRRQSSDLVLFGDCRPVHEAAIASAQALGVRVHVLEEGYLRPYWYTLERDGVNHRSRLPRDPRWFLEAARGLPPPPAPVQFHQTFAIRAAHDVVYHLGSALNPVLTPHYRTHANRPAPLEYAGFLRRSLRQRRRAAQARGWTADWMRAHPRYFLLPLQLDHDSQIRRHSRFAGMVEVVHEVMRSFAAHAPADSGLLIKSHPLDFRWRSLEGEVRAARARFGLEQRVHFVEVGDLPRQVGGAAGVVTVNSTVGTLALQAGRPVMALGEALYALPGLVFTEGLDAFWRGGVPPDPALLRSFEQVVLHATQINGGLYGRAAIDVGLAAATARLLAARSPLEELMRAGA